jgi:hypothetical protein
LERHGIGFIPRRSRLVSQAPALEVGRWTLWKAGQPRARRLAILMGRPLR